MSRRYLKYSFLFVIMVFCQAYIFGRINLMGNINPQVFVLFILIVPLYDKAWLMVLGFALGFSVDLLMGTGGIHTASVVLVAYSRHFTMRLVSRKNSYDTEKLRITTLSKAERSLYFALLLSLQSIVIYLLDSLRFYSIGRIGLYALISAGITWLLSVAIYPSVRDKVQS